MTKETAALTPIAAVRTGPISAGDMGPLARGVLIAWVLAICAVITLVGAWTVS